MNEIKALIEAELSDNPYEEDIERVCEIIRNRFGVQCDFGYAGGFDSPGYDIDCYMIAWIDPDGTLRMHSVQHETY